MDLPDDLGSPVHLAQHPTRVVCLVPSITESIAPTGVLVGATDWCTHPAGLEVTRVRGTKNPDWRAIVDLRPELVIANMEENREIDVRRLRNAGVQVWVTRIETVPQALSSLRRLFEEVLAVAVPDWLSQAERLWAVPDAPIGLRVAVPIWRDPWMVVGRSTFTGDLIERLGLTNVFADDAERYPTVDLARLNRGDLDLILLPDEPYVFSAADGPEAFPVTRTMLVSGRLLTWYGPSLVEAHAVLRAVADQSRP